MEMGKELEKKKRDKGNSGWENKSRRSQFLHLAKHSWLWQGRGLLSFFNVKVCAGSDKNRR